MIELFLTNKDDIQTILSGYPSNEEIIMHLEAGIYHQKLRLKHDHLEIYGSQTGITRITNADYSYKMHEDGLLYNTFRTWTVMCLGKSVELYDLEIENASGSGFTIGQAVALSLHSERAFLKRCKLIGHQDTLFIGPLPVDLTERYDDFLPEAERQIRPTHHHFSECTIQGDVDFIFGSGTAYFESCSIIALSKGYIAAPSTYTSFPYGFIFDRCHIISQSSAADVHLARPWRTNGATLFLNCTFEGKFHPNRYEPWDKEFMRFIESPYLQTPYSQPLREEETEQLKHYLAVHFNCSVSKMI